MQQNSIRATPRNWLWISIITIVVVIISISFVLKYNPRINSIHNGSIVLELSHFGPELGIDTGETADELENCHGAYFLPAIHVTTTFGAGNNPNTEGYFSIIPWEKLYINKSLDLMFDPQTIVIINKGALTHLTTNTRYHCTNRRFNDVYGIPDDSQTTQARVDFVVNELKKWSVCPTNWDCNQPAKFAVIEGNQITSEGEVSLNK